MYFPSIMCVRTSLAVPQANGDRPVIIMYRMTPRLHTSEREGVREGREEVGEGEGKGERKTPTVNRLYKHIPIPIHTCVHTPGLTCTVKVESQLPMYIGQHSLKHSVRNGKAG